MTNEELNQTDTEQRILKAAEAEFMQKGFDGARTTAISQRAGVTHAMLHYYFRTKKLLFERIIADKLQDVGKVILTSVISGEMPLLERVKRAVEQHFDFIVANPDLPRFIMQEIYSYPERHNLMQTQILKFAEEVLDDMQKHIDASAEAQETVWIDARTLLLDIISLNIFPFVCYPLAKQVFSATDEADFFRQRKAENVEIIMRRLKKI